MGTRKTEGFREGRDGAHVRQHVSRFRNRPLFETGDEPVHQQPSRIGPREDGVERAGPVEISIRNQGHPDAWHKMRQQPLGFGQEARAPASAIDKIEDMKMQAIPLRQDRQGQGGRDNLFSHAHRENNFVFQRLIEKGVGGVAAGNAVLARQEAEATPREPRTAAPGRQEILRQACMAEQPPLLGGEERGRTRRSLVRGKEPPRHEAESQRERPLRDQPICGTRLLHCWLQADIRYLQGDRNGGPPSRPSRPKWACRRDSRPLIVFSHQRLGITSPRAPAWRFGFRPSRCDRSQAARMS
ncbi:hypothetical protein [Shinella sp.]|uniref:hypothetical protein n=1 Tax=Shinella sp. TaxID=1870904 RepID=UPI003D2DF575